MESNSFGSFSITCRLAVALSKQPFPEKRRKTITSFMARYSSEPRHIVPLLQLILVDTIALGEPKRDANAEQLVQTIAAARGVAKEKLFGPHGTLSIEEAVTFVKLARQGGGNAEKENYLVECCQRCTQAEFHVLCLIANGNRAGSIGGTQPNEVLETLGGSAVAVYASMKGDISAAVFSAMGGSPRAVTEAEMPDVADDAAYSSPAAVVKENGGGVGISGIDTPASGLGGADQAQHVMLFRRVSSVQILDGKTDTAAPAPAPIGTGAFVQTRNTATDMAALLGGDMASPENDLKRKRNVMEDDDVLAGLAPPPAPTAAAKPLPVATTTVTAPAPAPTAGDHLPERKPRRELPPCKYGAGCIRKNPQHFKEYSHPEGVGPGGAKTAAPGAAVPVSPAAAPLAPRVAPVAAPPPVTPAADLKPLPDPSTQAINGVAPLKAMPEYEFIYVEGSPAAGGHKMKYCGDGMTYTCSCPVWRFQNRAANARTCKHLRAYLGDDFERERCGADVVPLGGGAAPTAAKGAKAAAGTTATTVGGTGKMKKHAMAGVLLAEKAKPGLGYEGWWLSEKLDGVRCYWNGEVLLTRNGNEITAPDWFTEAFPKGQTLDGELFGGRRMFQKTVGIAKSSAAHPGWKTLTYEVFDIPSSGGRPFEERIPLMSSVFGATLPAHVHVVEQRKCKGKEDLDAALAAVEAVGGEGLMLRQPGSTYVHKRSTTLLKVKSMDEVDAIIRGYDRGQGRNEGRVGALVAELASGKRFNCGSGLSDAQRNKPPSIGTVICVRCQGLTDGGVPRFPVFNGCRYDIDWPPAPK